MLAVSYQSNNVPTFKDDVEARGVNLAHHVLFGVHCPRCSSASGSWQRVKPDDVRLVDLVSD